MSSSSFPFSRLSRGSWRSKKSFFLPPAAFLKLHSSGKVVRSRPCLHSSSSPLPEHRITGRVALPPLQNAPREVALCTSRVDGGCKWRKASPPYSDFFQVMRASFPYSHVPRTLPLPAIKSLAHNKTPGKRRIDYAHTGFSPIPVFPGKEGGEG